MGERNYVGARQIRVVHAGTGRQVAPWWQITWGVMPVPEESARQIWAKQATQALAATAFGPVEWVGETGSTNADLLRRSATGAAAGLVRVTDYQNAGRGRQDRTWETAPGDALLVSVLLRPSLAADLLGSLTAAFGVAAVEACRSMGFAKVGLKWPNDLVVLDDSSRGYAKLAGILAQSTIHGGDIAVVVGMGLNVRGTELADGATTLDRLGNPPTRLDLLVAVLERFDALYQSVEHAQKLGQHAPPGTGQEPDHWMRYRQYSVTLGTNVKVVTNTETFEGAATNVLANGALEVLTAAGLRTVVAGDVTSLRPA